ncbi:unnamed protein product [Polarella glacialis]|uniref:Uncharacterized protein n=1 Tax=Polarella glacialis TaxID=89957 RepID=A0A813H7C6_POLGL|nr:unnamed protein product [Polarella glacialis]
MAGSVSHSGVERSAAQSVLAAFDRYDQEVKVLSALKQTAAEQLKLLAQEEVKGMEPQAELALRVMETETNAVTSQVEGQRVRLEVQSDGHAVSSSFRPCAQHMIWKETLRLQLPSGNTASSFQVEILREDGVNLGSFEQPLSDLQDQRLQHRWCTFSGGWRALLLIQWVFSPADLLRAHVVAFEEKIRAARASLVLCQKQLQELVPAEAWQDDARHF